MNISIKGALLVNVINNCIKINLLITFGISK